MKAKYYLSFVATAMALSLTSASIVRAQEVSDDFKNSIGKKKSQTSQPSSGGKGKKAAAKKEEKKIEEEKNMQLTQAYVGAAGVKEAADNEGHIKGLLGVQTSGLAPLSQKEGFKTYVDYNVNGQLRFNRGTDLAVDAAAGVPIGLGTKFDKDDRSFFFGLRPGVELNTLTNFYTTPIETKKVTISDPLRGDVEVDQTTGGTLETRGFANGSLSIGPRVMVVQKNDIDVIAGVDYIASYSLTDDKFLGEGIGYSAGVMTPSFQAAISYKDLNLSNGKDATELAIVANAKVWENAKGTTGVAVGGFHKRYSVDGQTEVKKTGVTVGVTF